MDYDFLKTEFEKRLLADKTSNCSYWDGLYIYIYIYYYNNIYIYDVYV